MIVRPRSGRLARRRQCAGKGLAPSGDGAEAVGALDSAIFGC
jgi:hypothetical protein